MPRIHLKQRFEAPLFEGHKGVIAVLVPFNPETVWHQKPFRLAGRRHGWLVKGSANGARFTGYVGERWGRFFIALEERVREEAGATAGDVVAMLVEPATTESVYLAALKQSRTTTQPNKRRSDALSFEDAPFHSGPARPPSRRPGARERRPTSSGRKKPAIRNS
jgi:hypothetical protein